MTVNAINLGSPSQLHQPLFDVPSEIALQILSNLSPSDLVKVSGLSSAMQAQAAPILWKELWLQHPTSLDPLPVEGLTHPLSTVELHRRRDAYRQAAKEHILKVLAAGFRHPHRWKHVHTINAMTYRFSTHHIATILGLVHDNLITLRLHCPPTNLEYAQWGPHDGILSKLGDLLEPFPLLAHLDLLVCHNSSYDQVLRFVGLAPALKTLRVIARDELPLESIRDPPDEPWLGLPDFPYLHTLSFDFPDDDGLPDLCQAIIMKAPNLRKVTLGDIWADLEEDGWSDEEQGEREGQYAYFDPLGALDELEHMDWRCGSYHVFQRVMQTDNVFAGLKTLVIDGNIIAEYMERLEAIEIPAMPTLKTLVFRTRHPTRAHDLEADTSNDDSSPTRRLSSKALRQLASVPNLTTIRFSRDDDVELTLSTPIYTWDEVGVRGIVVSSYQNGSHQLVHTRTLTRSRKRIEPVTGQALASGPDSGPSERSVDLEDVYGVDQVLRWEHAVAYDGVIVTAPVMDRAFEVEGQGWRHRTSGRNQQLPDRVWLLLEIWKDRILPNKRVSAGEAVMALETMRFSGARPGAGSRGQSAR